MSVITSNRYFDYECLPDSHQNSGGSGFTLGFALKSQDINFLISAPGYSRSKTIDLAVVNKFPPGSERGKDRLHVCIQLQRML